MPKITRYFKDLSFLSLLPNLLTPGEEAHSNGERKIHINLRLGLVEAEGDETFVRTVYEDFKERLHAGSDCEDVTEKEADQSPIDNYWQDGQLNLGTDNLKRTHEMRVTGLIQKDQRINVSLSLDGGNPVQVFIIEGDGSYVDEGISTTIGSRTIGSKVIGDGGSDNAHPFDVTFPVHTDKYQSISVRFEALAIPQQSSRSSTPRPHRAAFFLRRAIAKQKI